MHPYPVQGAHRIERGAGALPRVGVVYRQRRDDRHGGCYAASKRAADREYGLRLRRETALAAGFAPSGGLKIPRCLESVSGY